MFFTGKYEHEGAGSQKRREADFVLKESDMEQQSMQFTASRVKKLQEEMTGALSDLYRAIKELEAECSYLSAQWKGVAADSFFQAQRALLERADSCGDKTEILLIDLLQAEQIFTECEAQVADVMKEGFWWD